MIPMVASLLLLATLGCTDAVDELTTCDGGNLKACYVDGQAALKRARPDYTSARTLFGKACSPTYTGAGKPKDNIPEACADLAMLVRDGKGGPRDLPRAAELFEIACRGEIAGACVDLGLAVYDPPRGADVTPEPARAVELFFNGCNQVDPEAAGDPLARACDALGRAYEEGQGVENNRKDPSKASDLYIKACDAKHAPGCVHAGRLVMARKVPGKVEDAVALFDHGCRLDARHGGFELAQLHEKKAWKEATPEDASNYYQKTCNIDPTRGCYEAAQLMEKGLVDSREGEIESLYNLACEHGSAEACTRRNIE